MQVSLHALERLDDPVGVVLGLQARHVEDVALRSETQAIERLASGRLGQIAAVGDEDGGHAVTVAVVVLDDLCIRHDRVRDDRRKRFRDAVGKLSKSVPLAPVALEAVYVQDDARLAGQPRQKRRRGIDRIADEDGVKTFEGRVDAGEDPVHDGIEVLRRNGRKNTDPRAAPRRKVRLRVARAGVHRDLVSARSQARRKLLGERLESAVTGGDPAGAENADAHTQPYVT